MGNQTMGPTTRGVLQAGVRGLLDGTTILEPHERVVTMVAALEVRCRYCGAAPREWCLVSAARYRTEHLHARRIDDGAARYRDRAITVTIGPRPAPATAPGHHTQHRPTVNVVEDL